MEIWQKRQKHHEDRIKAHDVAGAKEMKYIGKIFWESFGKDGHSHGAFDECQCKMTTPR